MLGKQRSRRFLLSVALAAAVTPGAGGSAGALSPQQAQKQVLVLYATRRDAQLVTVGDRELPRILASSLPTGVDYYSEVMDQARYRQDDYQGAFRSFLDLKYEGHRFDVVIAMDSGSLEFIETYRTELFPETPIVFFSDHSAPRRPANSTGVTAALNLGGTLALASALHPDLRHVFVVNGASRSYEETARVQFRPFEPRLSITYLSGLPSNELENRLRTLPPKSIVYYFAVSKDGAGQNFHPLDYLQRVAAVANAPTYCWVDSGMGLGIVGGSLRSQPAQAEAVGALAVRVLRGERADAIPLSSTDLNVNQVDWRELRRWRISAARVPAGSQVRFREPSLWDQYRHYIVGGVAIFLGQAVLIGALLVQRLRRRQAEDRVVAGQTRLRASSERIRDLGGRLINSQEAERSRIARELHDDISQQVALLEIDLELLRRALQGDTEALADGALSRAQGLARSVYDLSHRLHPAKLRLLGLVPALHHLQHELSRPGCTISFTHADVPSTLAPDLTLSLFRVAQEALQNALKYSQAHEVSAHLKGNPENLELTIVDDGVGFDVQAVWGKGLGLVSMGERLEPFGGSLDIQSSPGAGTRLHVTVPLRSAGSSEAVAV